MTEGKISFSLCVAGPPSNLRVGRSTNGVGQSTVTMEWAPPTSGMAVAIGVSPEAQVPASGLALAEFRVEADTKAVSNPSEDVPCEGLVGVARQQPCPLVMSQGAR